MTTTSNSAPIFAGEYRHALDTKNRITIPARWRSGEADEFYISPHQEFSCLVAMPQAAFQQVRDNTNALPPEKKAVFMRMFASKTQYCTADKNGRLLLNEEQCRQVGLNGEVFLVGGMDRFEVWSATAWQDFQQRHAAAYKEVANSVGL